MHVLIRVDAGPTIGGGHVMRCLVLADALRRRGHVVSFVTNPEAMATVPAFYGSAVADEDEPADIVVVDHYHLSAVDQRRLRRERQARLMVVIDDLADRIHDADLMVDTGAGRGQDDYRGLVRADADVLVGTAYALIRPDILACRKASLDARRGRAGSIQRIVIAFGLSDTTSFVAAAVAACSEAVPWATVDVIVGPTTAEAARVLLATRPGCTLHVDPSNYAALLSRADLAIGGAGGIALERCFLGLPSLAVCMAQNQENNAEALGRAGAAHVMPNSADLGGAIRSTLRDLTRTPETMLAMARAAAGMCDGGGVERIVTAIERPRPTRRSCAQHLMLRPAAMADARFVWALRNDPGVRFWSRDPDLVPIDHHLRWFAARLIDPHTALFVAVLDGWPVGMVRFGRAGDEAEVSIAVSPIERKRGHGLKMLTEGCRRVLECGFASSFRATIHSDNGASSRLFASAGFRDGEEGNPWLSVRLAAPLADRQPLC